MHKSEQYNPKSSHWNLSDTIRIPGLEIAVLGRVLNIFHMWLQIYITKDLLKGEYFIGVNCHSNLSSLCHIARSFRKYLELMDPYSPGNPFFLDRHVDIEPLAGWRMIVQRHLESCALEVAKAVEPFTKINESSWKLWCHLC